MFNFSDAAGGEKSVYVILIAGWQGAKSVDGWQFLFSDLHKRNYMTVYSEDKGFKGAGTWQYRLTGFERPPTTHYTNQVTKNSSHSLLLYVPENFFRRSDVINFDLFRFFQISIPFPQMKLFFLVSAFIEKCSNFD